MIEVKKKKLNKRSLSLVITSSILVLLTVGMIATNAIIGSLSGSDKGEEEIPYHIPEIGESYYSNLALAYESFTSSAISGLVVGSHKGKYALYLSEDKKYYVCCVEDENGDITPYYPSIVGEENSFNYTSLYSMDDSGMTTKISYLFAILGTLAIDQRIELSSDEAERAKQLDRYGLGEGERELITVYKSYTVEGQTEPVTEVIDIEVGDELFGGSGYYYRVNGRNYVYTTSGTYLDYALDGFESFIKPNLVAPGLESDSVYEPYYTSDYRQWKNKITKYDENVSDELQALVKLNSAFVGRASIITPVRDDSYFSDNNLDPTKSDGYVKGAYKGYEFNLEDYFKLNNGKAEIYSQYVTFVNSITSSRLGKYTDKNILATIISDTLEIDFGTSESVSYTYDILKVESVMTDMREIAAGEGYECVGDITDAKLVKVTYDYYVDGEKKNKAPRHSVIELSDLDADTRALVLGAKLGDDISISFTKNYDKATANKHSVSYVISEIALILNRNDKNELVYADAVGENSIVTFRYHLYSDGRKISDKKSVTTDLSALTEGDYLKVKAALIGKSIGKNLDIVAFDDVIYTQLMQDFTSYSFESLDYFVEKELISAFHYVNVSEKNPFHSESFYKNALPTSNKYSNYALNATACEQVVRLLGGIKLDTSSNLSEGLAGVETIALGITPENMEKYGLYANTVYFELPRDIREIPNGDPDIQSDYTWMSTLGFTLYISDYDYENKCRYIASDMYDVIVKVTDKGFDYLDLSFIEFYARRNMIIVKYSDIEKIELNFNLEDFYGSYTLDTECETVYVGGGKVYLEKPTDVTTTKYEYLTVNASVKGENTGNKLTEYLNASGADSMDLADLYNSVASEKLGYEVSLKVGNATLGASSFQDVLLVMFNTYYLGTLTPEEQQAGLNTKKLMSMSVTVKEANGYKEKVYTYDFYRIDDRRVMVSLYNEGYDNAVNDFYITTAAFKKIISNYNNLLNGVEITPDVMYR